MSTTNIDNAVLSALAEAGIVYTAKLLGERTRDKWQCDAWAVTLTATQGARAEVFDYFTGLGHRQGPKRLNGSRCANPYAYGTHDWQRWNAGHLRPVAPSTANVLHSLILDCDATSQSFADWCADSGYDTDSRKALATYEACQENADKLRSVIPRDTLATLTTLLQDY